MLERRGMLRHAMLLAALTGLTACNGTVQTGADCHAPSDPAAFEIGTGEECFSRLSSGQEVPLMNGPQGGFHVWLAIGCQDCGNPVRLEYGVRDPATGMTLAGTSDAQEMVPLAGEGFPQAAGIIVYMPGLSWDPQSDPPPAKGTHVVLWAQAYDGDQLVHEGEVEVVIGDIQQWDPCEKDPNNQACQFG